MRIDGIIWLEQVVDKIESKHGVRTSEVEEVFNNVPRILLIEKGRIKGENLYAAVGKTDGGRHLTVFFICKKTKEALIVTARDMDKSERRKYEDTRKRG